MRTQNFYEILGIPEDANGKTIKSAYRGLAEQLHPDKRPGDDQHASQQWVLVQAAYRTLIDFERRKRYDIQRGYQPSLQIDKTLQPLMDQVFGPAN